MAVDLTFARQQVESTLLIDRCTVTRTSSPRVADFDENTGQYTGITETTVLTDVLCSVREREILERNDNVGGAPKGMKIFNVNLSYDVDEVNPGDTITLTTTTDTRILGVPLTVTGVHSSTLRVMRRVQCIVQEDRLDVYPR